jgi:branched-chain amino acid aminotransferase
MTQNHLGAGNGTAVGQCHHWKGALPVVTSGMMARRLAACLLAIPCLYWRRAAKIETTADLPIKGHRMTDHISTHQAEEDARNEAIRIFVNGRIVPKAEAMVSVYDSGFMLGDGVWEGIRLYEGKWAFLDEHVDRLFEAAKAIDLDICMTKAEVTAAILNTQSANGMVTEAHARLMVTRGVKTRPFQHPRLSQQGPTVVIIMEHSRQKLPRPIRLATVPHMRGLPMTQDPKLNSHSKLNCILACIAAEKAGADEALMLDVHGFVNTTNACNFFIVRKGQVWTSTGDYCMNGITRQKVIDLCRANDIPVFERNFSLVDTYSADEAFLTGTFGAQTPVASLDGRQIGKGQMGPMTERLRSLYKALVAA